MRGSLRVHSLFELIALVGWSLANAARDELASLRVRSLGHARLSAEPMKKRLLASSHRP